MAGRPRTYTPAELNRMISEQVTAALAALPGGSGGRNGCTYKEFMACKPLDFKGIEGPIGLTRWFEKIESVFRMSNCVVADQVKYASGTLLERALTWWNTFSQARGLDAAYATPWEELKRLIKEYCPRNEIQKMESEFWNLKMVGTDITSYNTRFLELALMCPTMVTPECKRIERYVRGLSDDI
ncbi:uncharacterized protein [Rutidosis leptorrhynchoides]|uniref:uncharacterized protein n=1 Tax=Rutidosis leptorrhynchoides TaxID=125765 RepID=UPI003A9A03EB